MINVALCGNPNVGKTTLFNLLTGSNQYVGNWPGVTVEKKEGYFDCVNIIDLPGIYAMDTYSNEEIVTKKSINEDNPDVILNIVDASTLSRNLYLTLQLISFKKPLIIALNMIDVCEKKGIIIDVKQLEKELGIEIIPISAGKKWGIDNIKERLKKNQFKVSRNKVPCLKNEEEAYDYIERIISKCVTYKNIQKNSISEKVDKIILHPILSIPILIFIVLLIFRITFTWVGRPLSDTFMYILNKSIIPLINSIMGDNSEWFRSLIINGLISGVGGIIALLPIILVMYMCIIILEDSGYMARAAFIMDKIMRMMGLSGKAIIPMIIGFGCTVPAVMASRTLESEKDRKLTALLVPFMSCNARLPVYVVFASVFFRGYEGLVIGSLYLLGIIVAFILGGLLSSSVLRRDEEPFLIEIPEYKMPKVTNIINTTSDKAIEFLKKAGSLIFAMSIIIWFLSNFNKNMVMCSVDESILAYVGNLFAPVFRLLGFGNWQSAVSLLCGLLAKETVLSTMQIIYSGALNVSLINYFNPLTAYSFLVFVLLYVPCISTCGTIKKEYGIKFMIISVIFQFAVAWLMSFCIFNIGSFIISLLL